jgi:hypothetical protein
MRWFYAFDPGARVRTSDLLARIGAAIELVAVMFNLFLAFVWFISLIWVLVGLLWALLGLVVLVEGALALFVLIKGYSPVGIVGPLIGLVASAFNFNFFFGDGIELIVLVLMIFALVLRGQEDAAATS